MNSYTRVAATNLSIEAVNTILRDKTTVIPVAVPCESLSFETIEGMLEQKTLADIEPLIATLMQQTPSLPQHVTLKLVLTNLLITQ